MLSEFTAMRWVSHFLCTLIVNYGRFWEMAAKEENLPLLKWIQDEVKSSGTDQYFEFVFNVGEKSEFQIRIKGGEHGNSEPDAMLENLADYEKLNIQIFEFPRIDPETLAPTDLEVPLPDGQVFKVHMD